MSERHTAATRLACAAITIACGITFKSGNSEAVELAEDVAFGNGVERVILSSGDMMTISPARRMAGGILNRLQALPTPPEIDIRETEPPPERDAL